MSLARRQILIGLLAAAALALAWFAPEQEDVVGATTRPASDFAGATAANKGLVQPAQLPPLRAWPVRGDYEPLPEKVSREVSEDVSAAAAAAAASAAVTPPPPPPPPTPKVPFRYLGSLLVDGHSSVFLGSGNDTLTVRMGAVLPGGWRLDSVATDRLEFTFLPTDSRQSLTIAAP